MDKEQLIRALEYTEAKYRNKPILNLGIDMDIPAMCSDVLSVIKNCIEIPEGATNGYVVKTVFPDARVSEIIPIANGDEIYYVTIEKVAGITNEMRVTKSWWDAPFKTDKKED